MTAGTSTHFNQVNGVGMLNKTCESADEAVSVVESGATILISGFGDIGLPFELLHALARTSVKDLTIVSNNAGTGELGLSRLFRNRQVSRLIASFPSQPDSHHYFAAYQEGLVDLELVPQGTLAERIRAAGAGLAGFFTPTGYGTELAQGKECRMFKGKGYVSRKPCQAISPSSSARRRCLRQLPVSPRQPDFQSHHGHGGAHDHRRGQADGSRRQYRSRRRPYARRIRRPDSGGAR